MLIIQDPTNPDSLFFHEALVGAFLEAKEGAAAFAWATEAGVNLIFGDTRVAKHLQDHKFTLVIGLDAVTTPSALERLAEAEKDIAGLVVKILLPHGSFGLFHPKFSWVSKAGGGQILIGSGNLTIGGLRGNIEAFASVTLTKTDVHLVRSSWDSFITRHKEWLVPPSHKAAIERSEKNKGWSLGSSSKPTEQARDTAAKKADDDENEFEVLIAEIPRGSTRWNQANFTKDIYLNYFGAEIGTQKIMLFRHLCSVGSIGELEVRPSVQVKSHNYRFELHAASGLAYPTAGRPIGVFIRVRPRAFLYHLSMPGTDGHDELVEYLDDHWTGRADRRRRLTARCKDVDSMSIVRHLSDHVAKAYIDEELSEG